MAELGSLVSALPSPHPFIHSGGASVDACRRLCVFSERQRAMVTGTRGPQVGASPPRSRGVCVREPRDGGHAISDHASGEAKCLNACSPEALEP
jgi:hypothetical protein